MWGGPAWRGAGAFVKVPSASCTKATLPHLAGRASERVIEGQPSPRGGPGRGCLEEGAPVPRCCGSAP